MGKVKIDENNPSFVRINEKCIDCGQCLNTCQKQNCLVPDDCISCGQCILTCPMGALVPRYNYKEVLANVHDEEKIVVISVSPAVRVAIGDEFGFDAGTFLEKQLVGILKQIGFDYVFDTTFGADLTIMEEAAEFVERITNHHDLPMFTSCCPSWVLNMEKYHSEDIHLLSTCKSPISMQSAIIKSYFAREKHLNPEDIVVVALAPCVSKKSEAKRNGLTDTDYVITTSELSMLIREEGLDLKNAPEEEFDSMLGKGSGAGVIFGSSGGVMEAALRTAYYMIHHEKAPENFFSLTNLRGTTEVKEATIDFGVQQVRVAVLYGIANVNKLYKQLVQNYDYIEVMTCPNGCVGGAGQPILPQNKIRTYVEARGKSLYQNDSELHVRTSYENEDIKALYANFLKEPLSKEAETYLHTEYEDKSDTIKASVQ